ncbi:MAG TPA: FG-GAP-like repeat-containing protein, partial [Planctomycetota bacterium]|nr:FG-GAP-like repeat-containing protein [Planctomycetota bacterium]
MRLGIALAVALSAVAPSAPAQRFGFTHQMLPADHQSTQALAIGDADGDGDLDVVVGNTGGLAAQPERLYLNDGTGIFTDATATNMPFLIVNTQAVALGDVDGDGDLDAFAGNSGQDVLYLNGGTGIFTVPIPN